MKKTITTLLILFLTLGIFAETGYNNHSWLIKKENLQLNYRIEPGDDKLWEDTAAEKKPILGKETVIYYHFGNDVLYSISYCTKNEKTELIKKKMPEPIMEIKTISIPFSYFVSKGILSETNDLDLYFNKQMAISALNYELDGYDQLKEVATEDGACTISIYDYNDDTRVYIFDNNIEGLTFVVYTYHEQDY